VVFAACVPAEHELLFTDEHLQTVDLDEKADLVFISMMLTCQVKRGWEIADRFRARGVPVVFGGIATQLHPEETAQHADAIFLGEAEGRVEGVLAEPGAGKLKKVYDYLNTPAPSSRWAPREGRSSSASCTTTAACRWWTWCTPRAGAASTATRAA